MKQYRVVYIDNGGHIRRVYPYAKSAELARRDVFVSIASCYSVISVDLMDDN